VRIEAREQNVSFPTAYYGTLYYNVRASGRSNKETRDGVKKEREKERERETDDKLSARNGKSFTAS